MPKYAAKVDANQKEVVSALRYLGFSVVTAHAVGGGFPDLVLGRNGKTYLVEIKDGEKYKSQTNLTEQQVKFHQEWRGHITILYSTDDALAFSKANK